MTMSETPSHFVAVCPSCLVSLKVRLVYSGSPVRCKHCDHKFCALGPDHSVTPSSEKYQAGPLNTPGSEAERADAEPRTADQRPESAGELAAMREENERLGARLETLQQDHAGIQSERDSLLVQLEQFRGDHDRLRSEHEQDRQEHQRLRDELASIRDALGGLSPEEIVVFRASAEQAHGDERSRLEEQLHLAREELDSAWSEIGVLQSRLSELLDRHDQFKADHLEAIEAQRSGLGAQFQAELEAERSRHVEQIAELHARTEADAQLVERLKAEILTIAQSRSAPDADLEAAREEIAGLRAKLADTETTKRSMSSLLEGMGIRLH
jgi:chromosome segregation ATPase